MLGVQVLVQDLAQDLVQDLTAGGGPGPSNTYPGPNKGKNKEENTKIGHTSHVNRVSEYYAQQSEEILGNENLTKKEKADRIGELHENWIKLASKSSSSYNREEFLAQTKSNIDEIKKIGKSTLTNQEKKERYMEIMDNEKNEINYQKNMWEITKSGHTRNHESADERKAQSFKGIPKDNTAPNLGGDGRSKQFEETPRQADGSTMPGEVIRGDGIEVRNSYHQERPEEIRPDNASEILRDMERDKEFCRKYVKPVSRKERAWLTLKNVFKKNS